MVHILHRIAEKILNLKERSCSGIPTFPSNFKQGIGCGTGEYCKRTMRCIWYSLQYCLSLLLVDYRRKTWSLLLVHYRKNSIPTSYKPQRENNLISDTWWCHISMDVATMAGLRCVLGIQSSICLWKKILLCRLVIQLYLLTRGPDIFTLNTVVCGACILCFTRRFSKWGCLSMYDFASCFLTLLIIGEKLCNLLLYLNGFESWVIGSWMGFSFICILNVRFEFFRFISNSAEFSICFYFVFDLEASAVILSERRLLCFAMWRMFTILWTLIYVFTLDNMHFHPMLQNNYRIAVAQ